VIGKRLPAFGKLIKRKLLRSGEWLLQLNDKPQLSIREINVTKRTVQEDRNAAVNELIAECREDVELLVAAGMRREVIGAVAYQISYLGIKANRTVDMETGELNLSFSGISFPWRVCLDEVIAALVVARGDETKEATQLNAKSIKNVAFYCPSADGNAVLEAIHSVREITLERARLNRTSDHVFLVARVPGVDTPLFWVQDSSESRFEFLKIRKDVSITVEHARHSANTLALDLTVHFG
jgi:hypothetical protein